MTDPGDRPSRNFIQQIIDEDNRTGTWGGRVHTRFPPEPNGYLHIGHAMSICLNFGLAAEYGGACNLRFDDTNPTKEEDEYVRSITEDVAWLGFEWDGDVRFASDYFPRMYEHARELIGKGLAYVDEQSPEEIRRTRGTATEPGTPSPYRDRPAAESLDLLERMKAGEFPDGSKVLRAKIDMASPNFNLRDPVMYRILHAHHHRTGDEWCIYPMYDWAHGLEDSYEGITHSICTLEFENHRPLYDWFLDNLDGVHHPQQIEFARLAIDHTVMSKRLLLQLVNDGVVRGWDDPRMPTVSGMRRRGIPASAIRKFCSDVGVSKVNSVREFSRFESVIRDELNRTAPRVMAVLRPLKLIIENYPEGQVEQMDAVNNPEDESAGVRQVPFSRELWIEQDDFRIEANRKYHRLTPGKEVRLRYGYLVTCTGYETDANGDVVAVTCTYDPETRGGDAPDGRKVRGTIHWVSAGHAVEAEVRLFDRLFNVPDPAKKPKDAGDDWDFKQNLNPASLEVIEDAKLEPSLRGLPPGSGVQFERMGYFAVDPDSTDDRPVFNRTATLRDTWAAIERNQQPASAGA